MELEDDDGEPVVIELPVEFEVCWQCSGSGTHVDPAIDGHGLTHDDFADDPDFAEAYFNGAYDVQCYECGGRNVVPVVVEDPKKLNEQQKVWLKMYHDYCDEEAAYQRICEYERRYGA